MREEQGSRGSDAPLYPVALKLEGRRCVVVGGGAIALRKTQDLLACRARVHAIAPEWRAGFGALERGGRLVRSTRGFEPADLDGACLVVAATDDRATQEAVAARADALRIPCNVVDVNALCSFYVPAVLRRGALTVAVSTSGVFPLLAVALRDRIADSLPDDLGASLKQLGEGRALAFARCGDDVEVRVETLRRLLPAPVLASLLEGDRAAFEAHLRCWKEDLP